MTVDAPTLPIDHPDRVTACSHALDVPIREMVDEAITKGWKAEEVYEAMALVLEGQRVAYGFDPDPADD